MKFRIVLISKGEHAWQFLVPGCELLLVQRYAGGWAVPINGEYVHFTTLIEGLSVYAEDYTWGNA